MTAKTVWSKSWDIIWRNKVQLTFSFFVTHTWKVLMFIRNSHEPQLTFLKKCSFFVTHMQKRSFFAKWCIFVIHKQTTCASASYSIYRVSQNKVSFKIHLQLDQNSCICSMLNEKNNDSGGHHYLQNPPEKSFFSSYTEYMQGLVQL